MPEKVQGRFTTTDGVAVNVDFTYNATNQEWTGKAKFLTSGEYTMQFLVLDGKYVELDPDYWHTASVTLGMRVEVYTTSPHTFKYLGEEMPDNQKMLHMQVRILDNAGNSLLYRTSVLPQAMIGFVTLAHLEASVATGLGSSS